MIERFLTTQNMDAVRKLIPDDKSKFYITARNIRNGKTVIRIFDYLSENDREDQMISAKVAVSDG